MQPDDPPSPSDDLALEPPGWRLPRWAGAGLWAATVVFILLVAPHFVLPVVAVEAAAFLCVTALGGRRRWRTFLWLTPLVWLLTFPLVAVAELSLSRQTHLIGSLLIVVGCQILRLLACTSALREEERSNLPPIGQLLGILFVGIGCGAGYAWLLMFGTIDAWDVDPLRQTINQTGADPLGWGLIGGLATVSAAVFASALVSEPPRPLPGRGGGSGWWPLTGLLAVVLFSPGGCGCSSRWRWTGWPAGAASPPASPAG